MSDQPNPTKVIAHSFRAGLRAYNPAVVDEVMGVVLDLIDDYTAKVMDDPNIPVDEKGRHAQLISHVSRGFKSVRTSAQKRQTQPNTAPRGLHNAHLA